MDFCTLWDHTAHYLNGAYSTPHCISSYTPKSPAPSRPTAVSVSQNGLDSVLVSWTPPSGEPDVTGYIIYYHGDGCRVPRFSENVGATATSTTISRLIARATYYISMVATSSTLPSYMTWVGSVTIGTINIHKLCCF